MYWYLYRSSVPHPCRDGNTYTKLKGGERMLNDLKAYVLEGSTVASYIAFCAVLGGAVAGFLLVSTL